MRHYAYLLILFTVSSYSWGAPITPSNLNKRPIALQGGTPAPTTAVLAPPAWNAHLKPSDLKLILTRILQVAPYCGSEGLSASSEKLKSSARAVSAFQPSLVSAVLRLSEEGGLSLEQIEAFRFLRQEILLANPHCKFALNLNIVKYPTPLELTAKLQEINTKLEPDSVIFVVSKNNEVVYPSALAKGIDYLHAHGQLVGYEGPASMIPDDIDFFVTRAENGDVRREEISSLRAKHHLPVLVQIPMSFWNHDTDTHGEHPTPLEQVKLLTHLAEEQNSFGYHLIYPLFSAISLREHDFRKAAESSLLVTMRALMARFN